MTRISDFLIGIALIASVAGCTQTRTLGVPSEEVRFNDSSRPNQPPLALNDRVKVAPKTGETTVGTLIELTPDMLFLGEGHQFETENIRALHVSWGTQRLGTRGILYGGLIGAGIGLAAGLIFDAESSDIAAATVATGLAGMLGGYWAGRAITYETWKEVPSEEWRQK